MLTRKVIYLSAKADRGLDFHTHSNSYNRQSRRTYCTPQETLVTIVLVYGLTCVYGLRI